MEAKKYIDGRGWKYKVMLGRAFFKVHYQKADKTGPDGWKCVRNLPWSFTPEGAQEVLDNLAREKGWKEWQE